MNSKLPLAGITIADFTWIGAGAYTTKMLGDLGADVIKIESSVYPDSLRLSAPFKDKTPGINRSGYFADRNTSKRSMVLNLKEQEGIELVRRLIAGTDIVANNFTPGTMEKLGLGYDDLSRDRKDLIYLSMSTQGADGPESNAVGYGLTISALTGLHFLSGLPGHEPAGTGTNYPDHIPNPGHAAFAVMAALRHRNRTGEGQRIDIAQTEPTIAMLANAVIRQAANGVETGPEGNHMAGSAPRGVYPCAGDDRWIAISIADDLQWRKLVMELGALVDRPAWTTYAGRAADQDALDQALATATRGRDAYNLMTQLQDSGIAAGVVQTARDIVSFDPQLRHIGHWRRLEHPEMDEMTFNGLPFRFAATDLGPHVAAPLIGEHTDEICRTRLGLSDAEIDGLRDRGVLK